MQRTWVAGTRVLLTGLLLIACTDCFLTELKTINVGMAPPTIGWTLLHQATIKTIFTYTPINQTYLDTSSTEGFLSDDDKRH